MGQGLSDIGVAAPAPKYCGISGDQQAAQHLTVGEMKAYANQWHANLVRFQVSQPTLATATGSALSAYIAQIQTAVTDAETAHLGVILSMQDQKPGCGDGDALPSQATVTAWHNLAPAFSGDPNVMYELFNEPQNATTAADWKQWENGGCAPIACLSGKTWVGHQTLIDDVRALHAPNVILVDGAQHAETFAGAPIVHDDTPGKGIVYAVHPYSVHQTTIEQAAYGWLTPKVPVLITEWNYKSCTLDPTTEMAWWKSLHIGLTGWSGDVPGSMILNFTYAPTSCTTGTKMVGGTALQKDFGA